MHLEISLIDLNAPLQLTVTYGFAGRGVAHAWIYDAAGDHPASFDYATDASAAQVFDLPVSSQVAHDQRRFVYLLVHVTAQASLPSPVRAIVAVSQGGKALGEPMALTATVTAEQQMAEMDFTVQFS